MNKILYSETQRFPSWMTWMLVFITSVLPFWAFIQQVLMDIPFGENPMSDTGIYLLFIMPVCFVFLFSSFKLEVKISHEEIQYKMQPFNKNFKHLNIKDIQTMNIVPAKTMRKYGGRGVKIGMRGRSYFLNGKYALEIIRKNGHHLVFSINKHIELDYALKRMNSTNDGVSEINNN
ncbi:hypothetical protein ACFLSI_01200 [Bacteroidota bacterium]